MKALAASSVRQYETAVESLAEYNRTIEAGLQIALRNRPESIAPEVAGGGHQAVIVFGSDQGMCGAFNEQVATFALEQLDALGDKRGNTAVLPVDRAWLDRLASRDWDSRSLPTFTMEWRELFSSLIRQHLFVALYRAFAESLASENASRLASMQAAERNIQGHLDQLALDYHQGRQESIQAELLDIVAGFETLTGDEKRSPG